MQVAVDKEYLSRTIDHLERIRPVFYRLPEVKAA